MLCVLCNTFWDNTPKMKLGIFSATGGENNNVVVVILVINVIYNAYICI